jgi:hypothetical protein
MRLLASYVVAFRRASAIRIRAMIRAAGFGTASSVVRDCRRDVDVGLPSRRGRLNTQTCTFNLEIRVLLRRITLLGFSTPTLTYHPNRMSRH